MACVLIIQGIQPPCHGMCPYYSRNTSLSCVLIIQGIPFVSKPLPSFSAAPATRQEACLPPLLSTPHTYTPHTYTPSPSPPPRGPRMRERVPSGWGRRGTPSHPRRPPPCSFTPLTRNCPSFPPSEAANSALQAHTQAQRGAETNPLGSHFWSLHAKL